MIASLATSQNCTKKKKENPARSEEIKLKKEKEKSGL
jgi:hypothetical protein